ncbi:hypothetical protein TNCV_2851711 [Trichonephila clavipes]|nr:hypothetical protein TNCV_2851711 [Trichonephila clavipes]
MVDQGWLRAVPRLSDTDLLPLAPLITSTSLSKVLGLPDQYMIACDEHESSYEPQVFGYPVQLRHCERKWTICASIVWGKISNEAATESSNARSGASELEGTIICQSYN